MAIQIGDKLPAASFKVKTADGVKDVSTDDVFKGKKVVLFAVPGAFTPTCTLNHLPGYLANYDALIAKGVDTVAVVSVNDVHVMGAWAKATEGEGKIVYLSDGIGAFTKAAGLDIDLSGGGLGYRSKRYSALIEDGVVKSLDIEENPGVATVSSAEAMLEKL